MTWNDFLDGTLAFKTNGQFDESEHPRQPAGGEKGGQFAPKRAGAPPANQKYIDPYKRIDTPKGRFFMGFDSLIDTSYGGIPERDPREVLAQYVGDYERRYDKKPNLLFAHPLAHLAKLAPDGYGEVDGVRVLLNPGLTDRAIVLGVEWKPSGKPRAVPNIETVASSPQSNAPASDAYLREDLRIPSGSGRDTQYALLDWNATFRGPYLNDKNEIRIPSSVWNEPAKNEWKKRKLHFDGDAREWYFRAAPENAREQLGKARAIYDGVWGIADRSAGFGAWLKSKKPSLYTEWQTALDKWKAQGAQGGISMPRWNPDDTTKRVTTKTTGGMFDESEHPRVPAGNAGGGQFAPKQEQGVPQWGQPRFPDYAYSRYGYRFTEKDIDTIVGINNRWMRSEKIAWEQVKSKAVRNWAQAANLAVLDKEKFKLRSLTKDEEVFAKYRAEEDLPAAALWRVFKQRIFTPDGDGVQGMTVIDSPGWLELNIRPRGKKYFGETDMRAMEQVLSELDKAGYVHTDFAGSVWRIEDVTRG